MSGKSIEQKHALALQQQGWSCPVCLDPIKPGMRIAFRLSQIVHPECVFTYTAPFTDGAPWKGVSNEDEEGNRIG